MPTLDLMFNNLKNYYVKFIDQKLIDYHTDESLDTYENLVESKLSSQPICDYIARFTIEESDLNYDFNPQMDIEYCNTKGVVIAKDIYGKCHELKFVMNLQLTSQVFDRILL